MSSPKKVHTPFSSKELESFKELIFEKRNAAKSDVERMREEVASRGEHASEDSAYSYHMADAGTDAMEREKKFMMIARQQKYIGYLDRALERIENKSYGICKITGDPISRERLRAVPHTEISISAKKAEGK